MNHIFRTNNIQIGVLSINDIYTKGLTIASYLVLYFKQIEISTHYSGLLEISRFAID